MQPSFDPFMPVRQMFADELARQEGRLLDFVLSVPSVAIEQAKDTASQFLQDALSLLGRLSHAAADEIIRLSAGPRARPLNAREQRLVREAYGDRVSPSSVRIVPGPGYSTIALAAFINGNPAITLGSTIFIKPGIAWLKAEDLPRTVGGVQLLLHEYMHVVQYARLGFAGFGSRYATELRRYGSADRLYHYESRHLPFDQETLEGQAQIVGDMAGARLGLTPSDAARAVQLQARLRGTGIYGN